MGFKCPIDSLCLESKRHDDLVEHLFLIHHLKIDSKFLKFDSVTGIFLDKLF